MQGNGIQLRAYDRATHEEAVLAIWYAASLAAHKFIGAERLLDQRALIKEVYLPQSESWVALHSGEVVGFISLLGASVGGLFIQPKWQGKGIGRKLVTFALEKKGELSLEVYLANKQAVGFYKRLGFKEISRRDEDDLGFPFPNATLQLSQSARDASA